MPANLSREIDRTLALAAEYDLGAVLYGVHGAYTRIEALEAAGVSLLVSLDWPEEEADRDPDADTAFRTLYHRRMAPTTPAKLTAAGIPFGFYSDGLSSPSKVFEKLRDALDAGLSEDAALEALTLGAARILGVDDRLGSIETGKIANLVLANAPPWAEDVEVAAVFVDGHRFAERSDEEEDATPPASDVSGTWAMTLETPRGSREMTGTFTMSDDGKVSGEVESERGTTAIEKGKMRGDVLTFKMTRTMGPRTVEASYSLTVSGEEATGSMRAGPMSMELSAERTATAAKTETAAADDVTEAELAAAMQAYQGPAASYDGPVAITNARIYTVSGPTIENGTVLIEDGTIRAVGADVDVPRNATVVDAVGGSLIPGIVDAHSHIAIEGGGNEGTLAVTSMVTIQDVINPDDINIYRALAGGVTTINVLHGSANPIGGGNAVLKLRWGADADGLRFAGAPAGIKFALGENPKRSRSSPRPGEPRRYPVTRMGVMDVIRQAFTDGRGLPRGMVGIRGCDGTRRDADAPTA